MSRCEWQYRGNFLRYWALWGVALALQSSSAWARVVVLTDVDDTLFETRIQKQGTFETAFRLFLIEHRSNTLQAEPVGPKVIEVSPAKFAQIKDFLGKGSADHGAVGMKVTLADGTQISPGNYMAIDPETFEYFGSHKDRNYLLEDFLAAEKRKPLGNWRGEFWPYMQVMLNFPEIAEGFGVLTARTTEDRDWVQLFQTLKERGYIAHLPNFKLMHAVNRPEYDRYGVHRDTSKKKVEVIRETVLRFGRVPLTAEDERMHPSGEGRGQFHYFIFADDNQKTIELAAKLFQELAQNRQIPVKFALFNMGTEAEVKDSGRPRWSIVEQGGTFRRATTLEMAGEPKGVTEEEIKKLLTAGNESCERILASVNKGQK